MRMQRQRGTASTRIIEQGRLIEEIAMLEKRLAQIGPDGDCGYEKALIRFFEQQLGQRRELLSNTDSMSATR